jgi:hypothetical protein
VRVVQLAAGQSVARKYPSDQVRFTHALASLSGAVNLSGFLLTSFAILPVICLAD